MEFKGTPAPWEITAEHLDTRLQINHGHIDLWFGDAVADQVTREQVEANAHLIASAPELLEALIETEKDLCVLWGQMIDIAKTNHLAEGMPDLIEKWRGRNKQAINKALNI